MGGLRPEEEVILLPLLHIADDGGGLFRALGIVGNPGARKVQAEADQVGRQLHHHNPQNQGSGTERLLVNLQPDSGNFPGRCSLGSRFRNASRKHGQQVQHQEYQIIDKIQVDIPFPAEKLQGDGLGELIGAGQHRRGQDSCQDNPLGAKGSAQCPGPVGHEQHHKAVQEAEPVGNHVGKVEAVPDIVQLPDDEADIEEQQQPHGADLIPKPHFLRHQVQEHEKYTDNAAVQIWQSLLEGRLQTAAHVSRHLTHGVQQTQNRVLLGDVQPEGSREFVHAGLGAAQSRQSRDGENRGHADGNGGKQGDPTQVTEEFLPAAPPADLVDEKQEKYEDAGKKANIIVGKNGEKQADGVKHRLFLLQKAHRAQGNQRKQGEGIQPHHVPLIAQCPGAQAIERAEYGDRKVVPVENPFQKQAEEQTCKTQLDGNQQGKIAQQPSFRHQHAEQIQGRCQVVGDETQIVHAQTHAPGIEQSPTLPQGVAEGHEEGVILVVHIGIQHGIFAEGDILAHRHQKQHPQAGNGKADGRIVPFFSFFQFHGVPP